MVDSFLDTLAAGVFVVSGFAILVVVLLTLWSAMIRGAK